MGRRRNRSCCSGLRGRKRRLVVRGARFLRCRTAHVRSSAHPLALHRYRQVPGVPIRRVCVGASYVSRSISPSGDQNAVNEPSVSRGGTRRFCI